MKEKRLYARFSTHKNARGLFKGKVRGWEECTIINLSRKGMGVIFHTREKIKVGTTIYLEIPVPWEKDPLSAAGELTWIKQEGNEFTGGIELTELLDDVKWSNLC